MHDMPLIAVPPLEASLQRAYEATEYRVLVKPVVVLHIGRGSVEAADLLRHRAASNGIIVSAWNPFSRVLTDSENDERDHRLHEWIHEHGLQWLPAEGVDPSGAWRAEASALVMEVDDNLTDELLTQFEQHAVVEVSTTHAPRLVLHPQHRVTREAK